MLHSHVCDAEVDSKSCEPACLNGGVCDNKTGECVCPSDLNGPQCGEFGVK